MDIYKKKKLLNLALIVIFILALVLQFIGHGESSARGLLFQLISLALIILVLYLYNRNKR